MYYERSDIVSLKVYRNYHAMIFLHSAATSEEWYKEDYDADNYH